MFHQYTLIAHGIDRNELRTYLAGKDIPAMVYYPLPLHEQKAYSNSNYTAGSFPVAEFLSKSVISLPIHTEMDQEQLQYITSNVLAFVNKKELVQ